MPYKKMNRTLNPDKKVWIYTGLISLIIFGFFILIWYFKDVTKYLFISMIILYMIRPFIKWFQKQGLKKHNALALIIIILLIMITSIVKTIVPAILIEIDNFNNHFPEIKDKINQNLLREVYDEEGNILSYYSPMLNTKFDAKSIDSTFQTFMNQLQSTMASSLSLFISSLILVPILLYLLIKEGEKLKKQYFNKIPNKYFEAILSMAHEIDRSIENFISAKVIQSLIIAATSTICFYIIGLKLPYLMGLMVGIFNIIPYLGPFIGAIPPLLIGYFFGNEQTAIFVLGTIIFIQLIDNILIQPFLIPRMINEHPLIIVIITLIGADILGPIGMVLAIPIFSISKTIIIKSYHALDIIYSRKEIEQDLIKETATF